MGNRKLILASSSPRRLALLRQVGYTVEVVSPDRSIEKEKIDSSNPVEYVEILSKKKMLSVVNQRKYDELVIGADTIVFLKGKIFEKPKTTTQAIEFLRELSGETHQVYTGIAIGIYGEIFLDCVKTEVTFQKLSEEDISAYVLTGEPLDKAGAYGIQERGALFVKEIKGCYFNVVGFPLSHFYVMLKEIGDHFYEYCKNKRNVSG